LRTLDNMVRGRSHSAAGPAVHLAFAVVVLLLSGGARARSGPADLATPRQLVETKIRTALSSQTPPAQRNQLLDEAIALMKAMIARTVPPQTGARTSPEALLEAFRLRLRLIETIGLLRCEEHAFRLLHLRGGPADRRRLAELTQEARGLIASLEGDMERVLGSWSADLKKLVTVVPELEDIQTAAAYSKVWTELYAGLCVSSPPRRAQVLRRAVAVGQDLLEEGVCPDRWRVGLTLALGTAHRELGENDKAARFLETAAEGALCQAVRAEARFQLARNAVERADGADPNSETFAQAKRAIGALSRPGGLQADLDVALLEHALYAGAFRRAVDPTQAELMRLEAQEALLAFLDQHEPAEQDLLLVGLAAGSAGKAENAPIDRPFLLLAASCDGAPLGERDQASAEADLRGLIDSAEPVCRRLRPLALWRLGALLRRSGRWTEAGRAFLALAREHADAPLAEAAGLEAVRNFQRGLEELSTADRPIPRPQREEFVEAISQLQSDRPESRELAEWSFWLGWHLEQLAEIGASPADRRRLLTRAIAAYERQPSSSSAHMQARYRAIELRMRLWRQDRADPQARQEQGRRLLAVLKHFAEVAAIEAVRRPGSEEAAKLRSWAAGADLYAAEVLYDLPGRRGEAMAMLRALPDRWPETDAAERSAEFEIRKLLEEGQTAAAVARVREFHARRPGKGQQLLQAVLVHVRRRIQQLQGRPEKLWQLRRFRKDTLELAEALYQGCRQRPIHQRYFATQMLAEALLENGRSAEAAELFRQCLDYDMARLSESAGSSEAGRRESQGGLDSANLLGLARACRSLGRFNESLAYYQRLLAGLGGREPALYWRAELEYCQCLLKGFAHRKDLMRKLAVRIRQLRTADAEMGGLAAAFLAVELQANRLAP